MEDEAAKPKRSQKKARAPLTVEAAQEQILKKLEKAGPKGTAAPHPKVEASHPDAAIYAQALALLESDERREIFVDRRKPKLKYFVWKDRPELPPPFTVENAVDEILKKIGESGATGTAAPHRKPKPLSPERTIYERALALLASEERREIFVDRRKQKTKYFLWAYRPKLPTGEGVAARLLGVAKAEHPHVFDQKGLFVAATLDKEEKVLGPTALQLLVDRGQVILLEFTAGKKLHQIYLAVKDAPIPESHLTGLLRGAACPPHPALKLDDLRPAYDELVRHTGFPAVPIASLQRATGVPMDALKDLLRRERDAGSVSLSTGDWSMASEEERLGVIEMHERRYLQVRWET